MAAQMSFLIPLLEHTRRGLGKYSGWDQKLLKKLALARKYNGNNHLTKLTLLFQPHGKRDIGRPRKDGENRII